MKNFQHTPTRLYLFVLFYLMIGAVNAQSKKVIFTNNNQQTEIEGNASINVSTGDISITTKDDKLIVDDSVAILGFYPDTYGLESFPDGITVNWAAAYASSCTAEVTEGNANTWSGSIPVGEDSQVVTINTANTTLQLKCLSQNGSGSVTKSFTIVQANGGGTTTNEPIIDVFKLTDYPGSNPTIPSNGNYNIQWSVSNLTGSCSASASTLNHGGWNGPLSGATNSKNIDITGDPNLTISCTNGGNIAQKTINITNSGGGSTPVGCENVNPPTGMILAPVFDQTDPIRSGGLSAPIAGQHGYGNEFADLENHGVVFAHSNGDSYISIGNINIPQDHPKYFSKNGSRHLGASIFIGDPTAGMGVFNKAIYSMSTCPGDFDLNKTAVCVGEVNKGGKFYVSTDPQNGFATSNGCIVNKNETYYLNFFSGSGVNAINNPNERECGGKSTCGSIIQQGRASY